MGICPECDSINAGSEFLVSTSSGKRDPWGMIQKAVGCLKCETKIPAHIWELPNEITPEDARAEWSKIYRKTYPFGKLGAKRLSVAEVVKLGEDLLGRGHHQELIEHCEAYSIQFDESAPLWRLLGVAHGSTGNPEAARMSFLTALKLEPSDAFTLANYVTACFDCGDKISALRAIESFYDVLEYGGQRIVLQSLLEAVRTGLVSKPDLPPVIRKALEYESADESDAEVAVEVNGVVIIYHETDEIVGGHGYEVLHPQDQNTALAFIAAPAFQKGKSVDVFLLSPRAKAWKELGLNYASEIEQVRMAIESLAKGTGKPLGLNPPPLPGGYKLRGGF